MKAIVILGAAVWPDGPSPTLMRRTKHAADLWAETPDAVVVPCGGLGKHPPTEASVMTDILMAQGVPEQAILPEDKSTSTYENLRNAAMILKPRGISTVTVVTNGYHGPRARLVARTVGLRTKISAPDTSDAPWPQHYRMVIREVFAIPAYAIRLIWWRWRDRGL